jgi:hypothetical protein
MLIVHAYMIYNYVYTKLGGASCKFLIKNHLHSYYSVTVAEQSHSYSFILMNPMRVRMGLLKD